MTGLGNRAFPILFWSIAAAWTAAVPVSVSVPVPVQAGTSGVQRNMYGPTAAEILAAYLEDQDAPDSYEPTDRVGQRRDRLHYSAPGRTLDHFRGISGSGRIDPVLNSWTAGRVRVPFERFATKRNIDEIDRSPFDNFFKKSTGRLDRSGWIGSDDDRPSFDRLYATLDR
ncbi:orcokinin peptides isoform X2 [Nomia melanderi]|uniref:orcokinin peptides isoform X2 n=1 Tax=Nomia melanderi TaxID=2448451 RepID=UPI0013042DA3|nr:orcokinin peptides-like isoform X2 [Nomia melanderi]